MKEKDKIKSQAKIQDALFKKALGYNATEVVEEYVTGEEGEIKLSKKKVTKKNVPPDITALKLIIDKDSEPIENLTDEELEKEKLRLLKMLSDYEKEN